MIGLFNAPKISSGGRSLIHINSLHWQLEAIHTQPELISSEGAMEQIASCEKDDSWKFAVNGILHTYHGNDHCHPEESASKIIGGWHLSGDGKSLTIRESNNLKTAYKILHLDAHRLELSFDSDEAEVTLVYRAIPANLLAFGN